jgi:hypothetical protein
MKFSVFALDYDGTIARDSKTHVTIADAIRDARRTGEGLTQMRALLVVCKSLCKSEHISARPM